MTHTSKLLAILKNLLVLKVVLPILTIIKRYLFTQTLSPYGFSEILFQNSRNQENCKIVEYSSRELTSAEKRYSQIEREYLAIVYGCKKNHLYLFGDLLQFTTTISL